MSRIYLVQFGDFGLHYYGIIPTWTDSVYDYWVTAVVGKQLRGGTFTYWAIKAMPEIWSETNPSPRKALMIVITDGTPYGDSEIDNRQHIISNVSFGDSPFGIGIFRDIKDRLIFFLASSQWYPLEICGSGNL